MEEIIIGQPLALVDGEVVTWDYFESNSDKWYLPKHCKDVQWGTLEERIEAWKNL